MYTKVLSILVLFLLSWSLVSATVEQENTVSEEYLPVEYYDFDLEVEEENGIAIVSWDKFEGENFQWYKLLYSVDQREPVYPNTQAVFVGNIEDTNNSFRLKEWYENHYIRLCAITLNDDFSKGRFCSEVKKEEVKMSQQSDDSFERERENKRETEDKRIKELRAKAEKQREDMQKKLEDKKVETRDRFEVKKEEFKSRLSLQAQKKADDIIESFTERLKNQESDTVKVVAKIETVIERLEKLSEQVRYRELVRYMIQKLNLIKNELNTDFSEIESIFSDL